MTEPKKLDEEISKTIEDSKKDEWVNPVTYRQQISYLQAKLDEKDKEIKMEQFYSCVCGIVLNLENLKQEQYDFNAIKKRYECPICKRNITEEVKNNV